MLVDDIEVCLLRTIIEERKTYRDAAQMIVYIAVNACADEIQSLGGDNAEFHADGIRKRLLPE